MALCFILNSVSIFRTSRRTEWLCIQLLTHNYWTACSYVVTNIWKKASMCDGKNIKGETWWGNHDIYPPFCSDFRFSCTGAILELRCQHIGKQYSRLPTPTHTHSNTNHKLHTITKRHTNGLVLCLYLYVSNSCMGLYNSHLMWRQLREIWDEKVQVSAPQPFNFVFLNIACRSTGTVTTHNASK